MSRIKVGFIGLGEHMDRSHARILRKFPNVELVGFFDPNVKSFSRRDYERESQTRFDIAYYWGIEKIDSIEELLSLSDAVFIGSPDEFHAKQLLLSVKAGKHVFVEKPIATTSEEMDIVELALAIASEHNLVVSSCHPRRFDPPIVSLKEHLTPIIDDIDTFRFHFMYHKATDPWKKDRSLMLDHLGHEVDLIRFLFGNSPMEAVEKIADSHFHYSVRGRMENGIKFEFEGHRILDKKVYHEFIDVIMKDGKVWSVNLNSGILYDGKEEIDLDWKDYDRMFLCVNDDFIKAIEENDPSAVYLTHDDMMINTSTGIDLI